MISQEVVFSPDLRQWPLKSIRVGRENALAAIGTFYFRKLLPKHFTQAGAREYKFQARDRDYSRVKRKVSRGKPAPLVGLRRRGHRAGELKRTVLRTGVVRGTARRVTVRMTAPFYVRFRGVAGTGRPGTRSRRRTNPHVSTHATHWHRPMTPWFRCFAFAI